jgi:Heterokaryon incompatibility protein (HET)
MRQFLARWRREKSGWPAAPGLTSAGDQPIGTVCHRCSGIKIAQLFRSRESPYSRWYEDNPTGGRCYTELIEPAVRRAIRLGARNDISFSPQCAFCEILNSMVQHYQNGLSDELYLVPAWGIERIEPSISMRWRDYYIQQRGRRGHESPLDYSQIVYIAIKSPEPQRLTSSGHRQTFTFPHESPGALGIDDNPIEGSIMGGKIVNIQIDYVRLKKWINKCVEVHKVQCKNWYTTGLRSIRLIDTKKRLIVPYKDGMRYICLSYVWGQIEPKSYSMGKIQGYLPGTIEDAMTAVKCLGERYLWVDSVIYLESSILLLN